jgi:hypothetical protein
MTAMDTTPGPDDISELGDADPAEAPEIADRIVDRLSADLDATEEEDSVGTAVEEEPPGNGGDEDGAVD